MAKTNSMYAIDRSEEYLAHYGIRGMKWGVRKAIQSGGTGSGNRRLARQYAKAQKKLAKLEKRANSGSKYARRAAALGAGAAAAGGLAALGTGGVASGMAKLGAHGGNAMVRGGKALSRAGGAVSAGLYKAGVATGNNTLKKIGARGGLAMIKAGNAVSKAGSGMSTGLYKGSQAVRNWGNKGAIDSAASSTLRNQANLVRASANSHAMRQGSLRKGLGIGAKGELSARGLENRANQKMITNNQIARAGAAALGLGLAGAAGYNAYRAATTKRAAKKAAEFRSEMNNAFKGTAYANGGKQQGTSKKRRNRRG